MLAGPCESPSQSGQAEQGRSLYLLMEVFSPRMLVLYRFKDIEDHYDETKSQLELYASGINGLIKSDTWLASAMTAGPGNLSVPPPPLPSPTVTPQPLSYGSYVRKQAGECDIGGRSVDADVSCAHPRHHMCAPYRRGPSACDAAAGVRGVLLPAAEGRGQECGGAQAGDQEETGAHARL